MQHLKTTLVANVNDDEATTQQKSGILNII
jgi:hypothetical protein